MKANRALELIVSRRGTIDHIEVVEIASGEVVLFWDLLPGHTRRMARALRADLAQLEEEDFVEKWRRYEAP